MSETFLTNEIFEQIVGAIAELPDRSSPEDWPEAMLVTADELKVILEEHLVPGAPAQQGVTPDSLVIHLLVKMREKAFVAHALELDLVASDDDRWRALDKLAALIQMQIKFALENNNIKDILFRAPSNYFAELPCAAPAPPVSEGLKHDAEIALRALIRESEYSRTGKLPGDSQIEVDFKWWMTHGVAIEKQRTKAEIESHGVTFLNPPLSEEEAEREQLQHARQAGLAKLKGACAYAAGFSIAAEHGYAGEHATAWRYGWEYARDFLSDPNVKNAMKPICLDEMRPRPSTEEGK